ncbi:MAG TPA: hypothetical protein ENK04_03490 [Gammaproteobacteria bacterium]|nr:hypothetical protein [Gammaproteobacteria bacterium]
MRFRVRWFSFWVAIFVGCLVNFLGDWLLGIRIELFWGLDTFNFFWFLQLFILPVLVGISVSYIYGLGGKWIAIFPPLIVRFAAYYQTVEYSGVPRGAELMPLGWWGFFVILAMEASMIGGVLGEIMNKRVYGWKKAVHVSDNDVSPEMLSGQAKSAEKAVTKTE